MLDTPLTNSLALKPQIAGHLGDSQGQSLTSNPLLRLLDDQPHIITKKLVSYVVYIFQ